MKKILWLFLQLLCAHQLFAFPLWGNLQPGPDPVGFTARFEYDYSRVFHAKPYAGNRARPIQIAIWYPAAKASNKHMQFAEYVDLLAQETSFDPLTPDSKKEAIHQFMLQRTNFAHASEASLQRLLESETGATRDAAALRGKFPLIVYAPGAGGSTIENTILCEYLASHGYIVAALPSMGAFARPASVDLLGFYAYMQDIEFVIGFMHSFPNVNPDAMGIVGFSMGGSAATLVQMRNFDIDAAVYLDTGVIYDLVDGWFRPSPYYNKTDLRAAQLYLVRSDGQGLNPKQLDPVRFADTYTFVAQTGYRHVDFVSDGMFTGVIDGYLASDAKNAKQLNEYVCESTLDFLDAYVKHDASKMQALQTRVKKASEGAGVFSGSYRASAARPPHEFELAQMLRDGRFDEVAQTLKTTHEKFPDVSLVRETTLNNVGYENLFRGNAENAIQILEISAQEYPQSANAQDSLSDAYLANRDWEHALLHTKKGLELLASDSSLTGDRKTRVQQALEQRLKQLQSGHQ